jgi:NifB/MoaA-like Fe-S oxidoreductase
VEYQPDVKQITGEGGLIAAVAPDSLAARLGLRPGDRLVAVGAQRLRDVIDYRFAIAEAQISLHVRSADGSETTYQLAKDPDQELGLEFAEPLFDRLRTCNNKCPFCFLTQMPRGFRKSLYLKDDDYRLSFLYNNFVTFTNLTEDDWARIEQQRLSPMHISVHATDPFWRGVMLGKRDLPDVREQIRRLGAMGVEVHTQIVACPGANDGEVLRQSIADLIALQPIVQSIAVVPVGLTKLRFDGSRPSTIKAAIQVHERPDWIDTNWERQPLWEEAGGRGQGTGDREQGTGDREQGTGDRGQGTGNRGQGTGEQRNRGTGEQGTEEQRNREQGTGEQRNREQGNSPHPSSFIPHPSSFIPDPALGFCSRLGAASDVPLRCFTAEEAAAVIDLIESFGVRCRAELGLTFVYPSDEFYILAGRPTPPAAHYDDMPQYTNGVGMVRDFLDLWAKARRRLPARLAQPTSLALVCGTLVAPMLTQVATRLSTIAGLEARVVPVVNQFFGEMVTVSGLLTAQDVIPTLRASGCARALLPRVMFDYKGERTIDDYSLARVAEEAGMPIALAGDPDELARYIRALARSEAA